MDGTDVVVLQSRGGLRFVDEALLGIPVARELGWEELEGDGFLERGVLGSVDDAHRAAAEFLEDLVVGDGSTDHGDDDTVARSCQSKRAQSLVKKQVKI